MRKVSFPTRDEVVGTTIVVVDHQRRLRGLPVDRGHLIIQQGYVGLIQVLGS